MPRESRAFSADFRAKKSQTAEIGRVRRENRPAGRTFRAARTAGDPQTNAGCVRVPCELFWRAGTAIFGDFRAKFSDF